MRSALKIILFVFIPICLFFFQVEKGRLGNNFHHKSGYVSDQGDVSADADDDDSFSASAFDDDEDDASEAISRIFPESSVTSYSITVFHSHSSFLTLPSRQISYRDVSPSFLRVFRI
jgi:hypothetical protein